MGNCGEKHCYLTEADADARIAQLRRRKGEPKRRSKRLNRWLCSQCGFFHVGHRSAARQKQLRERES